MGGRKKGTRWKSSPAVFDALSAVCQDDHEHLPFQVTLTEGQWSFDAAAEAAYPDLLTKRVASLVKRFWKIRAAPLYPDHCHGSKPWQYRINNTKSDQLIREFLTIQWIPLTQKLPPFQKLLHSFSKGDMPEEGINQEVPQGQHLVGAWHTPEQFVSKARGITHPMGENALDKIALDTVVNTDHRLLPRKEKEPSESKDQRKTDAQG